MKQQLCCFHEHFFVSSLFIIKEGLMKGYNGKILWIDLSRQETYEETIPTEWYTKYIGGEGFVAKLMYDRLEAKIDPLSKDNLLLFATGPLNGTLAPMSGRTCVGFKSPLTGTIGASNVGGQLAPVLKKTGYDIIGFKGQSEKPVYVYVKDSNVEFKDASHIWGLDVEKTEDRIREEIDEKIRIAEIGPAGENLVKYASIMIDSHRAAGRGGAGAVMGSKNLKALVVNGSGSRTEIDSMDSFNRFSKKARQELKDEPFVNSLLHVYGTPAFTTAVNSVGCIPTKNWQNTTYDSAMDSLGHEAFHETLDVKASACHACPVACGRDTKIKSGKYAGQKGHGPEYEGIGAFGAKTCVTDLNEVTMTYYLCNRYGIDIISAGQVLSTAMEWFEKGLIDLDTTDGIPLEFGNGEAMIQMIEKIAMRDGFGDVLAEGSDRAADIIGGDAHKYTFTVKGMELASCGVRASKGETLSHVGSERGADHLRPFASTIDALGYTEAELGILEKKVSTQDSDKAWVKPLKELSMLTNLLGTCLFAVITLAVKASTWTGLYNAVTGENMSIEDLLQCADRVNTLERLFNMREGFTHEHDRLPIRLTTEPAPDGLGKGQVVDEKIIIKEYYRSMGWHEETGVPTPEKLEQLGLK